MIFSAFSLIPLIEKAGSLASGIDRLPLVDQLNFIKTCIPHLKTLGIVYNPGEVNSVAVVEELNSLAKKKNIKIFTATVSKSSDIQMAAHSLVNRVDSIFVGNDNTVASALESLVKICLESKKPLFVSDPNSVTRGALPAYAYDQCQMGRQVGIMVARILNGEDVTNIPVEWAKDLKFFLNHKTAEKLSITLCGPLSSWRKK